MFFVLFLSCQPLSSSETPLVHDSDFSRLESTDTAHHEDTDVPVDSAEPGDSGDPEDSGDPVDPLMWRSALYPLDWTPDFTVAGHFLHDFSYAGYRNGEVDVPPPPGERFNVLDYGADLTGETDSTAAIQAAITAASASGGVVVLPAGEYRCDGLLTLSASGVVLQGAGVEQTRLFFTRSTNMTDQHHITARGTLRYGRRRALAEDGRSRSATIAIADASDLTIGDDVEIGWTISADFVDEHQMTGTWQAFNGTWRPFFRRTIRAIDMSRTPHQVTLDVPLRYPALVRDDASLRTVDGYLSEVGVQDLSISTVVDWDAAWLNNRSHAIAFSGVKDGWIQRIASYSSPNRSDDRNDHLQSGGILIVNAKRVTIAEAVLEEAQHRGGGGNGYLFEISRSSEVLIRDAVGRAGRHNFIQNWDFGTSGCVFLRTTSEAGVALQSKALEWLELTGYSEFHHSLAMANLIDDSTAEDGWKAVNRGSYSSGAGHSATQSVFWNLRGAGSLTSLQFGEGYIIGTAGVSVTVSDWLEGRGTAPEDFVEGVDDGDHLQPRSLYTDQLARRLARGDRLWE